MALKIGSNFVDKIMVGAVGGGANECRKIYQGANVVYGRPYITFDEQGGTPNSTDKYVYFGQVYGTMPSPTKSGYSLIGWYTASSGGSQVSAGTVVSNPDDHTLYAQWNYAPQTPSIVYYSKTATSISFKITNNAPYQVTVYYEHSDNTPDANNVILNGGATSGVLTISGLTPSTSYTIYAQAYISGVYSGVSSITQTTLANKTATPQINTPYKTKTWRYTVKNIDGATATIYSDFNGTNPPTTNRGDVASGANTADINTGYGIGGFTIYARAQASGKDMSDVESYYVS